MEAAPVEAAAVEAAVVEARAEEATAKEEEEMAMVVQVVEESTAA